MSHAVLTGPIVGTVTLPNGDVVDVTPQVITVADKPTADAVAHAIALRYESEGHPTDPNYTYTRPEGA